MKDQWVGRSVIVLVSLLVIWNLYKGITVQEVGLPGLTIKFSTATREIPGGKAWGGDHRFVVVRD